MEDDGVTDDERKFCILLAAGGTGGHIYPALALGQALRERDPRIQIHYFCGNRPNEIEIYQSRDIQPVILPLSGRSGGWTGQLRFLREMAKSYRLARRHVRQLQPDLAIGFGNYLSVPVLIAARQFGARTVIQEQNAFPGQANKFLARTASLILTGVPVREGIFSPALTLSTGNPVRDELVVKIDPEEAKKNLGLPAGEKICLCFGGSLGAQGVNQLLQDALSRLSQKPLDFQGDMCNSLPSAGNIRHFLWATGRAHFAAIGEWLNQNPDVSRRVTLKPYIDRMDWAYAAADVVVARAGALTLAEITALGKPAILIPLPHSAGDHQRGNAEALARAGAAVVIEEKSPDAAQKLSETIQKLGGNDDIMKRMGQAALRLGKPGATRDMVEAILRLLAGSQT